MKSDQVPFVWRSREYSRSLIIMLQKLIEIGIHPGSLLGATSNGCQVAEVVGHCRKYYVEELVTAMIEHDWTMQWESYVGESNIVGWIAKRKESEEC